MKKRKGNEMKPANQRKITILLVIVCLTGIVGAVFADVRGYGTIHPNFTVNNGLNGSGGWAFTGVKQPGGNYRPQAKCELQNAAGQQISANADWSSYGASSSSASCPNNTGSASLRFWATHTQWEGNQAYYWYETRYN